MDLSIDTLEVSFQDFLLEYCSGHLGIGPSFSWFQGVLMDVFLVSKFCVKTSN